MSTLKRFPENEQLFYDVAEVELKYSPNFRISQRPKVGSSSDAADILRGLFNPDTFELQEQFILLCLNNSNRVLAAQTLSTGGMTGTIADVRMIFQTALILCSTSIIISHNHPSGTLKPSQADASLTKKVKQAGEHLDIRLLDHIILTKENHYSFGDEGVL